MISSKKYFVLSIAIILFLLLSFTPIVASDVRTDNFNYPNIVSDDIFWFVHISDIHIGQSNGPCTEKNQLKTI